VQGIPGGFFFCSFKLNSVCILCIKLVFAPSPLQSMVCLSSELVSSARCSIDGEALLSHLSLLVLLKFRVCLEQLQIGLQVFHRCSISSILWKVELLLVHIEFLH